MAQDQSLKLDVLDLSVGAVRHLWSLRVAHAILAVVVVAPYALMGATGVLDPLYATLSSGEPRDGYLRSMLLMILWGAFWNTPGLVLWYRMFLVGPDRMLKIAPADFIARTIRLIGYSILFGLMVLGISVTLLLILSLVLSLGGAAPEAGLGQGPVMMVVLVVGLGLGGRLCLTFGSISLGATLPLKLSWARTTGHGLAISAGFLLCVLASTTIAAIVHGLVAAPFTNGEPDGIPTGIFIVDLVLAPLSYASTALVCAVTAGAFWRLLGRPGEVVDLDA